MLITFYMGLHLWRCILLPGGVGKGCRMCVKGVVPTPWPSGRLVGAQDQTERADWHVIHIPDLEPVFVCVCVYLFVWREWEILGMQRLTRLAQPDPEFTLQTYSLRNGVQSTKGVVLQDYSHPRRAQPCITCGVGFKRFYTVCRTACIMYFISRTDSHPSSLPPAPN